MTFRWTRSLSAALASLCVAVPASAQTSTLLTLGEAVDRALRAHPAITAADARIGVAEGMSATARGMRLPDIVLSGGLTLHQEPMVVAPLHSLDPATPPAFDRTLVQSQVGVQHTLYDGGMTRSRIRAADASEEATRSLRTSTEMQVLEETVMAYLGLTTARMVLDAARAQAAALEEERARAERHLDAGSVARVELLTANAVLQEARAEEAAAAARVALAERTLARLMGMEALPELALVAVTLRASSPRAGGGSSPVIRQAEQSVALAQARLSEERATRLPTVRASAGMLDFGAWEHRHALEWRAGMEITWPVFTGARGAAVRRAGAEVAAAERELDATRLRMAQEVDEAATAVSSGDERVSALTAAVAQWEEVARIQSLSLEAGAGEQRDLLRAEAGLFQARAGLALASQDALVARVRLARVEGVLSREWIDASMEGAR
jgi:outer membrane protein TolC